MKNSRYSRRRPGIQRRKRTRRNVRAGLILLLALTVILVIVGVGKRIFGKKEYYENKDAAVEALRPDMDVELLTVNPYSRPGTATQKITGIVVHYTANPGASAIANRNYFEGLKDSHETKASSNFIVGLDGEIVQCVPTWEEAYASNSRNIDTVSIECCHPDESGEFKKETYQSMVELCAWLCLKFDLNENDVIRHYDVTGKNCPKYFVEHEDAFEKFRADIREKLKSY